MAPADHAGSYYAATANSLHVRPALEGRLDADVCVVGGGATGLSAALHCALGGLSVVLLDGKRIGWGASGRNGGQLIFGFRQGFTDLEQMFGPGRTAELFRFAQEARNLVYGLIHDHAIDCGLKPGHLIAAVKPGDLKALKAEHAWLERHGYHTQLLDAAGAQTEAAARPGYVGGLLDPAGGHYHPLNYTLGLAAAAERAGARLHDSSVVYRLTQSHRHVEVEAHGGVVRARHAIVAVDSYAEELDQELGRHIMPVGNCVIATEPLPEELAKSLIPNDVAVADTKFVLDYYRLSEDRRLLFSGGERYSAVPPQNIMRFVRPHMLRVFPQLRPVAIEYAWSGLVSVTRNRLPHMGRRGGIFFAHGYSGQGAILSTWAGKLMADAALGASGVFDAMSQLRVKRWPGGKLLRHPLYLAGMLWFALRDRLP